ncbi:Dwarfin sma-4 [Toxocara canis]|uniref:Mothers against decapentaplegic homolog n=1 Tax=Toxocara canis TaxID=6265 RepID=A0A0B2W4Z5_TOXCA|nr:Dwarfin sma-4 [Toxocara canis]
MLNSDAVVQPPSVQMQMNIAGCVASPLYAQTLPQHSSVLADVQQQQTANLQQQHVATAFLPPIALQQMSVQQQVRMLSAQRAVAVPYQQAALAAAELTPGGAQFNRNYYEYSTPVMQQQVQCLQNQMSSGRLAGETSQALPIAHGFSGSQMSSNPSSSHHATASANDPCAQIAHVLQCYQQGGEDAEFVRKAIESLVKKLKDKRTELENLITAVTSGGKQPTSCVTIQRSLDGRLQVAGRKGVPHVVYARIWRWPNVSKNELQKLPICAVAPDNQDVICINPYHYERVVSSGIGNIDMSTLRLDSLASSSSTAAHGNGVMVASVQNTGLAHTPSGRPLSSRNVYTERPQHRSLDGRLQVAGRKGVPHVVYARIWRWPNVSKNELQKLPICAVAPDNQDVICINPYHYERVVSSGIGNIDMSTLRLDSLASSSSTAAHGNGVMVASVQNTGLAHTPSGRPLSSRNVYTERPQHHPFSEVSSQTSAGLSLMQQQTDGQNGNPWIGQGCAVSASTAAQMYQQAQGAYQIRDACRNFPVRSPRYDLNAVVLPPTTPPDHWCSISYYELDTQIGETFKVRKDQSEVIIDGGVNPAGAKLGRFCLGALPNVHRCEASEKARLHIGKGVRISTQRDGSVYLECLSHKSVFVRSYYLDFEHNIEYGMTVHKFCSGAPNRKIFDLRWAYAEMEQQSESARFAVVAQAAAVAGYASATSLTPSLIEHAGTGVDDLRRVCCTIAISFVKGWGSGYNRTSIKETPCWVELQLHRPLQLLDQLLKKNNDYYGCD